VFSLWNCCVVVLLLHVTINNVCGGTDLALVDEFLFCQGVFFFMELLFLHLFIDLCYCCFFFFFEARSLSSLQQGPNPGNVQLNKC
jgi:hypothetical protein